jgi:hypothetical protein
MRERAFRRGPGPHAASVLALAVFACFALPAHAQDLGMGDLGEVPEPNFVGQGLPMGSFLVLPSLTIDNIYNDNIFASDRNEEDDYIVSIIPALGIENVGERHSVSLGAFGKIDRYADFTSEDDEEYAVESNGRFDFTDNASVVTGLEHGRRTIRRSNSENTDRNKPEQVDFVNFDFSYRHEFGRFRLDLDPFVQRRDYVERSDADRDRTQVGGSPRIWYRFSPAFAVFLEPGARHIDYDRRVDDNGEERGSLTLRGFAGARFDITSVIVGEIAVGAVHMDFDESSFDNVTTVGARGSLTWEITRLTELRAEIIRRVAPTNLAGASSKIQTLSQVRVRHELLPNLFLRVDGAYFRENFKELSREDDNFRVRAGAEYLINRFLSVGVGYDFRYRDSDDSRRDFKRNVVRLAIELRL